jgi:hypothetical protein
VDYRFYSGKIIITEFNQEDISMRSFVLLFLITFSTGIFAQIPAGDSLTVKGLKIIIVEGDHYQRGLGYGYFDGDQIRDVAVNYYLERFFSNNMTVYNYYLEYFRNNFEIEDKYRTEAGGIIDGMRLGGIDLYSDVMGRELDSLDILFANAIVDFRALYAKREGKELPLYMGCSSLTSYGESTADDPELNGETVITRHLDWSVDEVLTRNQVMVVHKNTVSGERNFVIFGFAGMMGGLSILSDSGLSAFHNVGNYYSDPTGPPFHPMHFTLRNAVETDDYNDDGNNDAYDVYKAVQDKNRSDSYIVEAAAPSDTPYPSLALEVNNIMGCVYRDYKENDPGLGQNLVTTNHHRKLYDPIYCYRYDNLTDSLTSNEKAGIKRNRDVLCGAAGHGGTYQTIQFIPSQKKFSISVANVTTPGHLAEVIEFSMDTLFSETGIDQPLPFNHELIMTYPNPFNPLCNVSVRLENSHEGVLKLYNSKGSLEMTVFSGTFRKGLNRFEIDGRTMNSGVYFLKLITEDTEYTKSILLVK